MYMVGSGPIGSSHHIRGISGSSSNYGSNGGLGGSKNEKKRDQTGDQANIRVQEKVIYNESDEDDILNF